jgi:hypothetical protein
MRAATKEWLKLLAATAILAVPGAWSLHQFYCAIAEGLIVWSDPRARNLRIDWISYSMRPGAFVEGLIAYGFLAFLFVFAVVAVISFPYRKNRWRSRQFIDYAVRRRYDTES